MWNKLKEFVLRYSAPGALIKVYLLHFGGDTINQVTQLRKKRDALYQLPGCHRQNLNGIFLADFIQNPIKPDELDQDWLEDW